LQASILKGYSSQTTIVAFYCLFGTIQSAILSLIVVRDLNDWKISPDIELISIFYSVSTYKQPEKLRKQAHKNKLQTIEALLLSSFFLCGKQYCRLLSEVC